jgi:hypothetical protein
MDSASAALHAPSAVMIAEAEGLVGHARAMQARLTDAGAPDEGAPDDDPGTSGR